MIDFTVVFSDMLEQIVTAGFEVWVVLVALAAIRFLLIDWFM